MTSPTRSFAGSGAGELPRSDFVLRQSNTQKIYSYLLEHFGIWVSARELAQVGGFCAWRTRISDARKLARKADQIIEWNGHVNASAYRLVPKPLGRRAEKPIAQKPLFDLH